MIGILPSPSNDQPAVCLYVYIMVVCLVRIGLRAQVWYWVIWT